MDHGRFRRIATLTGAALFLASTPALSQDTSVANPPTTGAGAQAPFDTTGATIADPFVDTVVAVEREGRGFPWGLLGLLGLLGLMKRPGGTTVVNRDLYPPPAVDTRPRNVGTGTAADDRTMNLNPRPGGTNDPNRR
ncbi:MAG: hypothetical protein M3365_02675 [Gemmatimonadota bacterium]|nr:hypothetical protein [Gemmatimonadota bacterium]